MFCNVCLFCIWSPADRRIKSLTRLLPFSLFVWLRFRYGIFRYFHGYYVTQVNSDGRFRHKRTANDSSGIITAGMNDDDRWQDEVSTNHTVNL